MSKTDISPPVNNYSSDSENVDIKPDGDSEININDNMADDSRKIFVGGLSWETNEEDLKRYFSEFGEVKSCVIKLDRFTNQSRGFGFVIFDCEESVTKVLDHKEHILNKKKIDPKKAKPSREPQKKIFIGGIDPDMPESAVKDYFSQFGEIENIETPFDVRKNKRKAYLFITFSSESEARKASQQECQELDGKKFEVRIAVPRDQANRNKGWRSLVHPSAHHHHPHHGFVHPAMLNSSPYSPSLVNNSTNSSNPNLLNHHAHHNTHHNQLSPAINPLYAYHPYNAAAASMIAPYHLYSPEYIYSYLYSNPHLFNTLYNIPTQHQQYDPSNSGNSNNNNSTPPASNNNPAGAYIHNSFDNLSRQFQAGLVLNNNNPNKQSNNKQSPSNNNNKQSNPDNSATNFQSQQDSTNYSSSHSSPSLNNASAGMFTPSSHQYNGQIASTPEQ